MPVNPSPSGRRVAAGAPPVSVPAESPPRGGRSAADSDVDGSPPGRGVAAGALPMPVPGIDAAWRRGRSAAEGRCEIQSNLLKL